MKTLMIAVLAFFAVTAEAAAARSRDCLSQAQAAKVHPGKSLKYRQIGSVRCWYAGRTPAKSEFKTARARAHPPRATPSGTRRAQAALAERRRAEAEAPRLDVAGTTARAEDKQGRFVRTAQERKAAADDLAGLEGTLCAGPCEDLRTIGPNELQFRFEATHAAFTDYWLNFSEMGTALFRSMGAELLSSAMTRQF